MSQNVKRLEVVDALRGFSIVAIMLLHNIEHFDLYHLPEHLPAWMVSFDKGIWETLFFLFGGKVYAIFALLFGLTFYIQTNNQQVKGNDFRIRFAWRMALLVAFGLVNTLFYQGDILSIYAAIGLLIIPFTRIKSSIILTIAILLMLQPYEWVKVVHALVDQEITLSNPASWTYFAKTGEYLREGTFFEVCKGNLLIGKKAVILWSWENGRLFQTLSLFLIGLVMGRKNLFSISTENKDFWNKSLLIALLTFILLFFVKNHINSWVEYPALFRPLNTIVSSITNMTFMVLLLSLFVQLFYISKITSVLVRLSSLGKMSLSNYIFQSMIGSLIYYGYGLGMYKHTGATYSLLIGLTLVILQGTFSNWWLKKHSYGPLEYYWHKLTWMW